MSYTPPSVLVATRQGHEQQPDIILSVVLLGRIRVGLLNHKYYYTTYTYISSCCLHGGSFSKVAGVELPLTI